LLEIVLLFWNMPQSEGSIAESQGIAIEVDHSTVGGVVILGNIKLKKIVPGHLKC
jgi:hypothetical protein